MTFRTGKFRDPEPGRLPTQAELAGIQQLIEKLILTMERHRLEANARSTDALTRLLETWLINLEATVQVHAQREQARKKATASAQSALFDPPPAPCQPHGQLHARRAGPDDRTHPNDPHPKDKPRDTPSLQPVSARRSNP
jgi:hypothetical protein